VDDVWKWCGFDLDVCGIWGSCPILSINPFGYWFGDLDLVKIHPNPRNLDFGLASFRPRRVTHAPRIMAKKSWIARNARKKETVEKYAALRLKLKAEKDYVGLSMLPRDASPTRLVNRCEITGRRRAFLRRFRLSRITFRELASAGMLPGVTKSSW
jgi:small subunit ribosomal protein S14